MADWSQLPTDLLRLVLQFLPFLSDFTRFGAVCRSWQSVQREARPPTQLPWLVLCDDDYNDKTRGFFSLSERKTHRLKLPNLMGKRCCGSSHGWLITIDLNLHMHLLHPFSKFQIALPSPPPFPKDLYDCFTAERMRNLTLWKAIMSSDPFLCPENCVVMVVHGFEGKLAFYRLGDTSWTMISDSFGCYYDVIYYRHQFLGVTTLAGVVLVSELGPHSKLKIFAPELSRNQLGYVENKYLVDSMGDLLQVKRYMIDAVDVNDGRYEKTVGFDVFRLETNTREWVKMKSLGDRALFLGYGTSSSFTAQDYPGCKEDAIYFTDDETIHEMASGFKDLGIYTLEDGKIQPYYPTDACHPFLSPPLWLTPSLIVSHIGKYSVVINFFNTR